MYNVNTREFVRMPVVDGEMHKKIDELGDVSLVLGNIFYCENEAVAINLIETPEVGTKLRVHNPTSKPTEVTVRNQNGFDLFGDISINLALVPGETKLIELETR